MKKQVLFSLIAIVLLISALIYYYFGVYKRKTSKTTATNTQLGVASAATGTAIINAASGTGPINTVQSQLNSALAASNQTAPQTAPLPPPLISTTTATLSPEERDFDEIGYLYANHDVAAWVAASPNQSAYNHYINGGGKAGGRPFAPAGFTERGFLLANPDVDNWVKNGGGTSGIDWYLRAGGRVNVERGWVPVDFTNEGYYKNNPDVEAWVKQPGNNQTGATHYIAAGKREGRTYIPFYNIPKTTVELERVKHFGAGALRKTSLQELQLRLQLLA